MCRASEHNGKAAAFGLSLSIWGMGFDIKLIMEYILTTCWAVVRVCSGFTEKGEEEEMSRWEMRWVGLRDSSVVPQGTASRGLILHIHFLGTETQRWETP